MPQPTIAPMPPNIELYDGFTMRLTALDPTTGAVVTGVTISAATYEVAQVEGEATELEFGPFMLVAGPEG